MVWFALREPKTNKGRAFGPTLVVVLFTMQVLTRNCYRDGYNAARSADRHVVYTAC